MSTVPYIFATQTGNIPLSELDTNFANVKASVDYAAVSGTAGTATIASTANIAVVANTVTGNAQANITSVGTLVALAITGNATIGQAIGLGNGAIITDNSFNGVSFGYGTHQSQGANTVAIGRDAGNTFQGDNSVAVGPQAGNVNQGLNSVAIGLNSGTNNQGNGAVAIGPAAGFAGQGFNSVAIGAGAGLSLAGAYSVAIGAGAGNTLLGNNSIVLNATGLDLNNTTANTFTVAPVRNATAGNVLFYNRTTKEVVYSNTCSLSGNVTGGNFVTSGNITVGNVINSGKEFVTANYINVTSTNTYSLSATASTNILIANNTGYTATINMPAAPTDGQVTRFTVSGNTVTLSAGTGTVTPAFAGSTTAGTGYKYIYRNSNATWYRSV